MIIIGFNCYGVYLFFQNTILPEAVHFWERTLMVRETKNTIRLNR